MPLYEFRCACGDILSTTRPMTADTQLKYHDACGLDAQRIYSNFSFTRFTEHFNPAVGKVVSSKQEFLDDLKKASEDATRKTGIEHNFVPMEMPSGIDPDKPGMDEQFRTRRKMGDPRFQRKRSFF